MQSAIFLLLAVTEGIRMLYELSDDTLSSRNEKASSWNKGGPHSRLQPNDMTEGRDSVDVKQRGDGGGDEAELFRSSKLEPNEPSLDNWGITTDTIREVQSNLENYLRSYTANKEDLEASLYNLNMGSQQAVSASKSSTGGDHDRVAAVVSELYAALKTRCTSGTALLLADFQRRQALNRQADIENLVIDNPYCTITNSSPLKYVPFHDDIIVGVNEVPTQSGELSHSSLAIFQDGVLVDSWPLASIELPLEVSLALPSCFSFRYLGSTVTLCAPSTTIRDDWTHAITRNWLCLKDSIGKGFDAFSVPMASELERPRGKSTKEEETGGASTTTVPPSEGSTEPTTTVPPGLANFYLGWNHEARVFAANTREDLVATLNQNSK